MNFFDKIEVFLAGPMSKLANQSHMKAIRDGMASVIPLTIIGSLFLIIAFPPVPQSWKESVEFFKWISQNTNTILLPFRLTMGLLTIFAIYNTGYNLAKYYKLDGVSGGTLSLVGFFLTILPKVAQTIGDNPEKLGFVLPMKYLGAQGLFGGFIVAIFSVEMLKFFMKNNLVIKMPEGVPEAISKSFLALFPTLAVVFIISTITIFFKIDVHGIVYKIFQPLGVFLNGPFGAVLVVFFICLLWSAGLHGDSIIGPLVRPLWLELLDQNARAMADGAKILPNIAPEPFYHWFIWIGGSGCTIGLVFLMLFKAKSSHLKAIGKTALIPSIFNINEPVIFGAPIMLNPYLVIPFILGPITITITTYIAMYMNWVSRPAILVPWTFPAPIGAFLSTNGDIRALLLCVFNIILIALIFFPFFDAYDKKLLKEELGEI